MSGAQLPLATRSEWDSRKYSRILTRSLRRLKRIRIPLQVSQLISNWLRRILLAHLRKTLSILTSWLLERWRERSLLKSHYQGLLQVSVFIPMAPKKKVKKEMKKKSNKCIIRKLISKSILLRSFQSLSQKLKIISMI